MKILFSAMVAFLMLGCAAPEPKVIYVTTPAKLTVPDPLPPVNFKWMAPEDGGAVMVDQEGFGRLYGGMIDRNISYEYCRDIIKANNKQAEESNADIQQ